MPAMPPPTTITAGLTETRDRSSGLWNRTRCTAARMRSLALRVASATSVCTHESCSRMFTIWK